MLKRLLFGGLLLACAGGARAQTVGELRVPEVNAGAVATIVAQVPAPEGVDSASYTVTLDARFQSFAPLQGGLARVDDRFIIPLTFATPARLPAGRVVAGTLTVSLPAAPVVRDIVIQVREQRHVTFRLGGDELTVAPDAVAALSYTVRNQGNLPDTVYVDVRAGGGWVHLDAPRVILEPGETVQGRLRIAVPVSATPGDRRVALVTARSGAGETTETVNLVVASTAGWLGSLAHVPSSLFVGHSLGRDGGPVVALSGAGSIGPDTRVRLDVRHRGDVLDPALQRQAAGAQLRAAVTRPGLSVEAGDVYGFETTISGSLRQARGIKAEYDPEGPLAVRAIAAFPTTFGGDIAGGHTLHAETDVETRYGVVGLVAGDVVYPGRTTLPGTRATGAGLRWSGGRGVHTGSAEFTARRFIARDSLERFGPAMDVRYGLQSGAVTGRLRLRRVPDAAASPGGQGNELSASVSARLVPSVYLVAWGYDVDQNLLGNETRNATRMANAGLRLGGGSVQLQLAGSYSERRTTSETTRFDFAHRTVRVEGLYTRGGLTLQSDVEVGRSGQVGSTGAYRAAGGSVRFHGSRRWGWLRVQHTIRPGGLGSTAFNGGGTAALGPVEFSGGLTATTYVGRITTTFWSAAEIQAERNLSVHLGASARPDFHGQSWVFSLGISRRLNLPLPLVRQPDLHGVVFEDTNNNGRFDPGEPPVQGVGLTLGYLSTASGSDGRFAFRDAPGDRLRLHSGDLASGYVVAPSTTLPARGRVVIPLVRTASVTLDLFLDRDEDGERDSAEDVGGGASVTITAANGWERTVIADDQGRARISGLLPGHYAITARPASRTTRPTSPDPEVLLEVELEPGEDRAATLAVPLRRRTIRMGGDRGSVQFFESD